MPRDSRGSSRAAEKTRKEPGNGSGRVWPERGSELERQKLTASSPDIHRGLPHSVEAEQGVGVVAEELGLGLSNALREVMARSGCVEDDVDSVGGDEFLVIGSPRGELARGVEPDDQAVCDRHRLIRPGFDGEGGTCAEEQEECEGLEGEG